MTMTHLNSQVQQLGRFAHGQRVLGRAPKMPIDTLGTPHFSDFMNPKEAPVTKTHHLLGTIHQIRQSSTTEDFNGKLSLRLNRRFRQSANGGFSWANRCFPFYQSGNQRGKRRLSPWVIIGRFMGGFDLVHFSVVISGSLCRWHAFRKSVTRCGWARWGFTITFTER